MSTKLTIVEGNSNDKDNNRAYMVKGEKGDAATIDVSKTGSIATFILSDNRGTQTVQLSDGEMTKEMTVSVYNNVADMKADTTVRVGTCLKTLGYYSKNDGGGAYYITRTKTNNDVEDNGSVHFISENLVAELIVEDEIIVNQFGAYGNGTTNDTIAIQKAIDYAKKFNYQPSVKLLDKVYLISNINIYTGTKLKGESYKNTKILIDDNSSGDGILLDDSDFNFCYVSDFMIACKSANNNIENAIHIKISSGAKDSFTTFENIRVNYIPNGNGIKNDIGGRENRFNNIIIRECGLYGIVGGASDSLYYNITSSWNGKAGIWNSGSNNRYVNCKCFCNGTSKSNIRHELAGFYLTGGMSTFTACDAQENFGDGFFISQNLQTLINCKADANGQNSIVTDGVNPTDDELFYSGFYVSTEYTGSSIKNCNFIISADDFRRGAGRQLQKYGIDLEKLNNSNVILNSRNQVQDIYYGSAYSVNLSGNANNYVVLNGAYFGSNIVNGLQLQPFTKADGTEINPMIIFFNTDNKYRINSNLSNNRCEFQILDSANTWKSNAISFEYDNNNSIAKIGFLSNAPVSKRSMSAHATDLATAITLLNKIADGLSQLGLFKYDN